MRKALILAYDFPPFNSIGGQRPYSWFKYFHEFGIYPVVITRLWDIDINSPADYHKASKGRETVIETQDFGTVIRAPFNPNLRDRLMSKQGMLTGILRKTLSLFQVFSEHHTSIFDNKFSIYREADNYLISNQVDIIIATGEPFILFSYAAKLSRKFNIPWVADYRDGWSTNNNLDRPSFQNRMFRAYFKSVERAVVKSAKLITTASPDFSRRSAALMNKPASAVPVIYNGYFQELHSNLKTVALNPVFSIAHAGTIYPFQRVETFLEGVNLFLARHPERKIELTFYGLNMFPDQLSRIKSFRSKTNIQFTDKIPHEEMISKLCSAHVQLLLATPEVNQIYAKVFDYLATGRPILMVENDKGPLEEILSKRPNAGICSTEEEVAEYLERMHSHEEQSGATITEDHTFTRRNQTNRFAELLLSTIEKKNQ
ncbi:MAG: hypothetical protein H6601_06410 [Flavobacteriales bacterium]|nr:hypothetical protein [Flavobacteriales bacterium]